jgi:hypothetical protein
MVIRYIYRISCCYHKQRQTFHNTERNMNDCAVTLNKCVPGGHDEGVSGRLYQVTMMGFHRASRDENVSGRPLRGRIKWVMTRMYQVGHDEGVSWL